jgi:uncharacterized delta-60 repeat protein
MKTNHTQAINSIEIVVRQTAMPFYFLVAAIIIVVSLFAPHRTEAAAGDLDPRFGNGGVAITDFAQTDDYAYSVAVQADGKIVLSGQSGVYPDLHSALVRYNRNGRLDSTFGTGGKVVVTFNPYQRLLVQSRASIGWQDSGRRLDQRDGFSPRAFRC